MDYKLELGKLLKHCIEEANKRKNATAPLGRGVRMGYQNIRFAIDEIFERAQANADTGENNALLPDVSTRTCDCEYIEHFRGNVFKCPECNKITVMKDQKMIDMIKHFIQQK